MTTALDGMLVLELGSRVGVGACGSLLAQLGAEVVLAEPAHGGRASAKRRSGANFEAGKLRLNCVADPGLDRFERLIEFADVIILSTDVDGSPSWLNGLATRKVIMCDITAYGRYGALAGQPDSEWQVQARSGIVETTGLGEGPPTLIPFPAIEMITAGYAAASILAAARVRRASGAGQRIDMALYDCAFSSMATFLPKVLVGGSGAIRRLGNKHAMIAPWNVYKAIDGWLLLCAGSDAQWGRLCDMIDRTDLRSDPRTARASERIRNTNLIDDVVQSWVGRHSVTRCIDRLGKAQIACGPVVSVDGYPREVNLEHRKMICRLPDKKGDSLVAVPGSPFRMSETPGRNPEHLAARELDDELVRQLLSRHGGRHSSEEARGEAAAPLEDLRIVEIGHYTTVPLSAKLLGSLGAEVIKIEPPEGEATRDWPPALEGQGYFFTFMNSDKRSLVLDLRQDDDADTLRRLIGTADVLVENLKPGALARRGFSAQELLKVNPKLIYCSVSGFGVDSLYAGRPAYDSVIQAMSGLMNVLQSGDVPLKTGISSADLLGAEMAVVAILAAVTYRDRTGKGQYIDLSMQDIAAWFTQTEWTRRTTMPFRLANCRKGSVVAEMNLRDIQAIEPQIAYLDPEEACAFLERKGVRAAPVLSVHQMVISDQTVSRQLWFTAEKKWPLLANPMRLELTPPKVRKPMPRLGEDNDRILAELAIFPGLSHRAVEPA